MMPTERYSCPDCAKDFAKKYGLTRHASISHGNSPEGWLCPEGCGYSTARRSDILRHLKRRHMPEDGGKHLWVEDNSIMPKAYPLHNKISTLTHQEGKGPEEGEETISRAKLQEPLKKLREERPVSSAKVQGAPRPSVLERTSTEWLPLYPTVPTDLTKKFPTEFDLFQQRRDAVSTKQAAALNLNLTQQNPKRENTTRVVMDTRTITKEQHPVLSLQPQSSHETDLQYILNHRAVGHGNKKKKYVSVSWRELWNSK